MEGRERREGLAEPSDPVESQKLTGRTAQGSEPTLPLVTTRARPHKADSGNRQA